MDRDKGRGLARPAGLALLAILTFLLAIGSAPVAEAEGSGAVTFGETRYESSFGEYVALTVKATVAEQPRRVWFVYRMEDETADNASAATFTGGTELVVEYLWERYPGDMAPGTTVHYRWVVQTADGEWVESDESSFIYEDSRFDWQVIEQAPLTVYYYKNRSLAASILEASAAALDRLAEDMGVESHDPIDVYVYANESDMRLALPFSSQAYDDATVTLGMAMDDRTLLLLGRDADVRETAAHELSHIVVGRITDNPFNDLPRWLDEGLAMYAEGDLPRGNRQALDQAVRSNSLLSLRSMTSYQGDPTLVNLFYAQAYSLAEYMLRTYSPEEMRQLLAMLGEGRSIEDALQSVYGVTLADIEAGWRASLGLEATGSGVPEPTRTPGSGRGGLQHDSLTVPGLRHGGGDLVGLSGCLWPAVGGGEQAQLAA